MYEKQTAFSHRIINDHTNLVMDMMSDCHVYKGSHDVMFHAALNDAWERGVRHMILAGDITNNGYTFQQHCAFTEMKEYPFSYACALGNHDVYNIFHKHQIHIHPLYKELCIQQNHHLYYDCNFNRYHVYILNPERPMKNMNFFSEQQLQWLKQSIQQDDKKKPIFVVCHQPILDTHPHTEDILMSLGPQSQQLRDILNIHSHAIFISGHVHNSYTIPSIFQDDHITFINLPAFRKIQYGEHREGIGYSAFIYSDFIYIKTRDFKQHMWIESNEYIIDLVHGQVLPFDTSRLV